MNRFIRFILILYLLFFCHIYIYGQEKGVADVIFLNTPVLFSEEGKPCQQVVVGYNSETQGTIRIMNKGEILLDSELKKGENRFLLTMPAVKKKSKVVFSVIVNNRPYKQYPFILTPPRKWNVYFVQHSHTDIGYTRPQSEILAEHQRYIDYALDYCDQTDTMPDDAKFRWSCESAWVTREYLRTRPESQIKRLYQKIKEGRIEVTGMFANMSEIADENVMFDFLQPLKDLVKQGIPVKTAMQNDVNGIAWCIPDYMKNTGVKYLIMGINETRSIRPFDKPTAFWWEAPSGERLLAFRADHYMTANFFGLESPVFRPENMLWHIADLERKGYPFDCIEIQFSGYFTDNAPPSTAACEIVRRWNEKYESPKLRLAVASEFMEYVDNHYSETLPVYRNAWLDWWSDGFGSTSRETAEVRKTQNMKQSSEGVYTMVSMLGGELNPSYAATSECISENEIFFDEHTCGADESISNPYSDNSVKQWMQKSAYAWESLKKVTLFKDESMARLQPFFSKAKFPSVYVVNSMGWPRSGSFQLFIDNEIVPVDKKVKVIDIAEGKEVPIQLVRKRREGAYWMFDVENVPALGYKVLKIENASDDASVEVSSNMETLENQFYKIDIDKQTGAISHLFDKELNMDLIDSTSPYFIGQPVREISEKRDTPPFIRTTVSNVKIEKGIDGPVWESVKIFSDLEGFEKGAEGKPKGFDIEIRLYKNSKKIEFLYLARKLIYTNPEALYVAFPFSMPDSKIVFETIGGVLSQGDQLQGSSSDWNVVQNFVAVRGEKGQIILVSDELPLWQFSDFNMGKFERYPKPGRTWLYSWVMNNYWMTNFRAYQEGSFSWSYRLTSVSDTTNAYATKYAWGERNAFFSRIIPKGEGELNAPIRETLRLNAPSNVMLVNSRPAEEKDAVLLHFREIDGLPVEVELSSAVSGRPIREIMEVNALGKTVGMPLASLHLNPYEVKFIKVKF